MDQQSKRVNLPYRKNVALVLFRQDGKFLLQQSKALSNKSGWKFVQGGIDGNETPEEAIRREIYEELGTNKIKIIGKASIGYRYDWPEKIIRKHENKWQGQDQQFWFVKYLGRPEEITPNPDEIIKIKWVIESDLDQ